MGKIYTFNDKIITINNKWCEEYVEPVDPNPLGLPPNTIRVKFSSGYTPDMGSTRTLVDSTNNVWDIYAANVYASNWASLFSNNANLLEVLGANTTNITNMQYLFANCTSLTTITLFDTHNVTTMAGMFNGCSSLTTVPLFDTTNVSNMNYMLASCQLTTVPLFDTSSVTTMNQMFTSCTNLTTIPLFNTSSVTNMNQMFKGCSSLTTIPLFNTSSVTNMNQMFYNCTRVETGALALYQQASTQATPPSQHSLTFYNCGSNTTSGAAERAQIPSSWGGTGA